MTVNSGQIQDRHQDNSIADRKGARYILLSEIANKKVQTESGISIGRLKDLVFKDDPHYAEVTSLIVGRSMGRPPLNIPWNSVVNVGTERTVVQDPKDGQFLEVNEDEDQLLLWDRIIDKRILDTKGFAVEVVYDIELLLVDNKLFIVGADVGRQAVMRRLGLRRFAKSFLENGVSERIIPWRYVQPIGPDLTSTKGDVKLTIAEEGLRDIHPEDVADILEELSREERIHVFNALDTVSAANALEATEPRVQREILAETSSERALEIFAHLTAVQIADIISILPRDSAETLLKMLKGDVASRINQLLSQHDVPASILATRRFLAFPGDLTVADAFSRYREEASRSAVTMYIYIVDSEQHLRGVIDIMELLQADPKD